MSLSIWQVLSLITFGSIDIIRGSIGVLDMSTQLIVARMNDLELGRREYSQIQHSSSSFRLGNYTSCSLRHGFLPAVGQLPAQTELANSPRCTRLPLTFAVST